MAALNTGLPTLLDLKKRMDPDGKMARIIEMLDQQNEILQDIPWQECNNKSSHQTTVRVGLPISSYRQINAGSQVTKSLTAQFIEGTGIMDEFAEIDVKLAKMNKDPMTYRITEAAAKLESMNEKVTRTFFYGNEGVVKEEFTGFGPRFSLTSAANGQQIVLGGGSTPGQNASIWLVVWGPQTVMGLYPEGSEAGLSHQDLGEVTVENANGDAGARMQAYRDKFGWDNGLCVRDWRFVSRAPNIDIPALVLNSTPPDLFNLAYRMIERIKNINGGNAAIYCNRTVREMWGIQNRAAVKGGGQLSYDVVDGRRVTSFQGIPVRICDQLLNTEGVVA